MPEPQSLISLLGWTMVGAPALLLVLLGGCSLASRPLTEGATSRLAFGTIVAGLLAALAMAGWMLGTGSPHVTVSLGEWVHMPGYHFSFKLLFDALSLPLVLLTFLLCGTIAAFATRYMHREPGYNRFFVLYSLFVLGMVLASLAGTIETLFTGWELVGLSSALLVAFFHERPAPVRNGLHVWTVYRVSDAALLVAAVALHGMRGHGDFDNLFGPGAWPGDQVGIAPHHALLVGLLLLVAAAGKSALVPFSGWLPRAMEGPTPSSAVFYGALSVHLGAYLLLRVSPLMGESTCLAAIVVLAGLATAVSAALTARVQTDIKSALCYASLAQVGLIVAEVGMGWQWLALAHLVGHACLRTLQFLRAPTLLADYRSRENTLGTRLPREAVGWDPGWPRAWQAWWYRLALERFYFDALLTDYVAGPLLGLFRWCDRAERRWTDWLSHGVSRESDQVRPAMEPIDEY